MNRLLLFMILTILAFSCGPSRQAAADVNGTWKLVLFPASTKTLEEIFTMNKPQLQLQDGKVSGTTGCNRITGVYAVSGSNIQFGPNLAMTKMGCPNYDENIFMDAFNNVNRYLLENNELQLMKDSTVLMIFSKGS